MPRSTSPFATMGAVPTDRGQPAVPGGATSAGVSQRQRILNTALSLMAQRGVDGTSMRDLAQATGLNVASLYHYFPSKKDLLVAVLAERGFLDDLAGATAPTGPQGPTVHLDDLLEELLRSMLEVEDFIRLMLGEVMRGDDTALGLGRELMTSTQDALERWLVETQPRLCEGPGAAAVARMLRSMIIGVFFEHVAGVLDGDDPSAAFRRRAEEAAEVLGADDS
jgi:AcrR family transcriptional regulator